MKHIILTVITSLLPALIQAQERPPAPVTVDEAKSDTYSAALWVSGTVISRNDARIAAETDGRITWVAEVGSDIVSGEPLATIDDTDLRLELRDKMAQLESLQAQVRYQKNNLERLERLAENNNAAVNQLDEARAQLEMAVQAIRRAEVTVEQTQRRIEQTRVVAPFPGIVVERLIQAGEFVTRGKEVARLVDTRNREIRAQAPLTVSGYLREGLEVSVEHQERQTLSPVTRVIPVGDERSRMFEVRIASNDPAWVIGSPVRVALPNSDPRQLVAIPRDALVLRGSETFVLRVGTDNTVEKVQVSTGIGLGDLVEVIGQVHGGDLIVTRGAERLQAGQSVVIAEGS